MKSKIRLMVAVAALMAAVAVAQDTKYATSSTGVDPSMTFGPTFSPQVVKSLQTSCDVALGAVKFYTRTGKYAVTGTNSTTIVNFTNPSTGAPYLVNTNDVVVYVHANGTIAQTTVSAATSSNVTLAAALTVAFSSGDYLYDLAQSGQIVVADNTAAAGTNKLGSYAGDVFAIPADSPCYAVMDSATNTCFSATVAPD